MPDRFGDSAQFEQGHSKYSVYPRRLKAVGDTFSARGELNCLIQLATAKEVLQ
jgi:hypothetical protein